MGLFDWIKNVGSGILNTAKSVGGKVLGALEKGRDIVRGVSRAARNIPGVDSLLKAKIPVIGESLDDLGNMGDAGIEMAKDLGRRLGISSPGDKARDELMKPD